MKKISYLIIGMMLMVAANSFCQTSYLLTFKGEDKSTSASVTLDSIYIKNETSGEEITITDTFIYLTLQSGISEKSWGVNTFSIYQNYENVIGGQSSFNVRLPNNSNLVIIAYDITGKELCNYQGNLCKGIHKFDFKFGTDGVYIITANNGHEIKTFKTYKIGIHNANDFRITLIGSEHNSFDPVKKTRGSIDFASGDQLQYLGYSEGLINDIIYDIPTANKDYIFEFKRYYGTITDIRDTHTYKTVKIGNQIWMAENLAYLPSVSPPDSGSLTSSYYYVYDYRGISVITAKATHNYQTYGVLYYWPAAMNGESSSSSNPSGIQGVCPTGWHLPSDAEWKELVMYLGMSQSEANGSGWRGTTEGGKLKEEGTSHWKSPNTGGTNSSGFTALPGGLRINYGVFLNLGSYGYWWSSTEFKPTNAYTWALRGYFSEVSSIWDLKRTGRSVRCLKDY